ncbi:MAG: DNA polymerase IV [Desulfobacterium sp.]|nr:DNA polymerase IV [Desulfobacterium sp.]
MILHIDMDAFFASIEQRDDPRLAGKPIVVGGHSRRSVVATASYEARRFGIRSAMPMFMALERCPHLIVVQSDKTKYAAESSRIMAIFNDFTPVVEPVSIDEAYLDVTGCERIFGPPHNIAMVIKERVKKETRLTCSIGGAHLRFLAKIASDVNKPDGIFIIEQDQVPEFIETLEIKKIPGVGKRAMEQMEALGIHTLGDINRLSPAILQHKFGKFGTQLRNYAQGIDPSIVGTDGPRKSISSESTLETDTSDMAFIKKQLLAHAQRVGRDLRRQELLAENVTIKLKFSDFTQITRQNKLTAPICSSSAIYREAVRLVEKTAITKKIRLLGVGVSSFSDPGTPVQLDIFESTERKEEKWETVDKAVDKISRRFGNNIINKATLNSPDKPS